MSEQVVEQDFGSERLSHVLLSAGSAARGTVLIVPTVMGVQALELGFAAKLRDLGYSSLIVDLFGRRFQLGVDKEAAFAAMGKLRAGRAALRDRMLAVLGTARAQEGVTGHRIAATGYCFGGQCVLDLARSGADIRGVASFHGLFDPPGLPPQPIRAKVVAYHGWDDPMVPPEAVVALGNELTTAGADWQIHAYGHVGHGFTNPNAGAMGIAGVDYNEAAARRSWTSLLHFLDELFG
jgi:dienelactone hydrolase